MTVQQAYNNIRDQFELLDEAEFKQIEHPAYNSISWIKCGETSCHKDHCKVVKECAMLCRNEKFSHEIIPELEFIYKATK